MCVDGCHGQDSGDACEENRESQLEFRQPGSKCVTPAQSARDLLLCELSVRSSVGSQRTKRTAKTKSVTAQRRTFPNDHDKMNFQC